MTHSFLINLSSDKQLEFPHYVACNKPTLTFYCIASGSQVLAGENNVGSSMLYFEDIQSGIWNCNSIDIILSNGFETTNDFSSAPYDFAASSNPIHLANEDAWYRENEIALLNFITNFSRTESYALECDSRLVK